MAKRRLTLRDQRRLSPKIDAIKLNWTLCFLSVASLPFIVHLPVWPVLLLLGTVLWRWWLRRREGSIPHAVIRFALTIGAALVVYATFGTFNGIEPGSSLLLVMAAMKLLETVTARDLLVLVFMSFFMILAAFLFDQSLASTAIAILLVWFGATTLVQVNRDSTPEQPVRAAKKAGRIVLHAVPLLLILFVLFPRIPGPFWALPSTDTGTTGLSNSMSPGSISDLLESSEIAFRVYFDDPPPPRHQLYWRGPVLETLKGGEWTPRTVQTVPSDVQLYGPGIDYTMVLEPHQSNWLLGLEFANPQSLPRFSEFETTGELVSRKVVTERLRFSLTSHPDYAFAAQLDASQRALNLHTASTDNPQTQRLAESWRAQHKQPQAIVQAALDHYNQEPFVYSLTDARIDGTRTIDRFLFDRRRGFCEHYASSFTLLMRYAGIPARVVTGYMGGEINTLTGHLTVRQSDAHAWAEVWLEDRGWVRIDPTAAVAPERVEQGITEALPDGEFLPTLMMSSSGVMTGLRQAMDAINANWNNWVLGYSDERQWSLLRKLGLKDRDLTSLVIVLTVCVTLTLLMLALWLRHAGETRHIDPAQRLYRRFQSRLERLGIEARPTEDARHYAVRAGAAHPDLAVYIERFCRLYLDVRYGRSPVQDGLRDMSALLAALPRFRRRKRVNRQTT
ncbi:MAG: DUF3488 and transglutaminase-like domain-containing protein [Pseudomonadota bacterium]